MRHLTSLVTTALVLAAGAANANGLQNVARNAVGNAFRGSLVTEQRTVTFGTSSAIFNKQQISNFAGSQANLNQTLSALANPGQTVVVINNVQNSMPADAMPSINIDSQTTAQISGINSMPSQLNLANAITATNFQTSGQEQINLQQQEFEQYRSVATIQTTDLVNELFNEAATLAASLF